MPDGLAFALGPEDVALLRIEFLSILAADRGDDNIPFVSRALGCQLSPDHQRITLFFCTSEARAMLDQIARNGAIAVVFAVPSTHQALQLKGADAAIDTLPPNARQLVDSYCRAFVAHLTTLGFAPDLIHTLLAWQPDDLVAVTFTPHAGYSQTPGPRAGHPVGSTQ